MFQSKGVKGISVLALHKPFDICRGVVIDSLHCVYLGVALKLLKLWFDKDTRMEDFSIRTKVTIKRRMNLYYSIVIVDGFV